MFSDRFPFGSGSEEVWWYLVGRPECLITCHNHSSILSSKNAITKRFDRKTQVLRAITKRKMRITLAFKKMATQATGSQEVHGTHWMILNLYMGRFMCKWVVFHIFSPNIWRLTCFVWSFQGVKNIELWKTLCELWIHRWPALDPSIFPLFPTEWLALFWKLGSSEWSCAICLAS